jgi:hydrogenase maturation protease
MTASVVVLVVGNPSCADDALGPAFLARLEAWLAAGNGGGNFELFEEFQLQVEHALDLDGRHLALFVDAEMGLGKPFRFRRLEAAADFRHTSHTLAPETVLFVHAQTLGRPAPPSFVLGIGGVDFELGEEMSELAQTHLEAAWQWMLPLLENPDPAVWEAATVAA